MCATCGTDTEWDADGHTCKTTAYEGCEDDKPIRDQMTGECVENKDACTTGQLKDGSANECMACEEFPFWSAEQKACVG